MRIASLRQRLLVWYDVHRRTLPWRSSRPDPYRVLVSELMLQQTTVETVKPKFRQFIERFPSIEVLAKAPIDDVLHAWQGLGYYRRARSLHATAQMVLQKHAGQVPRDLYQLLELPGIGRYTAAAIAAIAFDRPLVPVDGNIARIVARLTCMDEIWPSQFEQFQDQADRFAGKTRSGDVAQALMDLGATICRPKRPNCLLCPLTADCGALRTGSAEDYPKKAEKKAKRLMYAVAFVAVDAGMVQLRRRPEKGLLAGLIELPSTTWHDGPIENWLQFAPDGIAGIEPLEQSVRHVFTHIDLRIGLAWVRVGQDRSAFWHELDRLDELALPTMTKKLLTVAGLAV